MSAERDLLWRIQQVLQGERDDYGFVGEIEELLAQSEPLSEDVVWDNLPENPMECSAFIRGVKFAEKAHGIGVDDDR